MPAKNVFKAIVKRVRKRVHPIGSEYWRYFGSASEKSSVLKRLKISRPTNLKKFNKGASERLEVFEKQLKLQKKLYMDSAEKVQRLKPNKPGTMLKDWSKEAKEAYELNGMALKQIKKLNRKIDKLK